ncbi:hypothetical protein Patl1_22047 [Pistacia atlantica]|uniref:Uncharacterized protein n=1 Tax=Pistacia atlantica TaxID=434234 RepID=A0ACC1BNX6_9ROSI|nr:hypothetical protein Patl1_22047 [Pistacia atlantica]
MQTKIFSKKLTQTDVRNRLSVRTRSLHFFPPFEDGQNAQDLMVEDEQGKPWPFRLVVRSRGRYKKPVLTAGWREFVSKKELEIGFKVKFFRENNEVTGEVKYKVKLGKPCVIFKADFGHYVSHCPAG